MKLSKPIEQMIQDAERILTMCGYVKNEAGEWRGKHFSARISDRFGPPHPATEMINNLIIEYKANA